jgi:hypothetical protein
MAAPPLPSIFGNYALKGISEVLPAQAISWLPTTVGWQIVAVIVLLLLGWRGYRYAQWWLRNRYRRHALQSLQELGQQHPRNGSLVPHLARLLKTTALQCYPRHEVASLSGDNWTDWLNAHSGGAEFSGCSMSLLSCDVYRPGRADEDQVGRLIQECAAWIEHHQGTGHA